MDIVKNVASLDDLDSVRLSFTDWRFNLHKLNTEPMLYLHFETIGDVVVIDARVAAICKKTFGMNCLSILIIKVYGEYYPEF